MMTRQSNCTIVNRLIYIYNIVMLNIQINSQANKSNYYADIHMMMMMMHSGYNDIVIIQLYICVLDLIIVWNFPLLIIKLKLISLCCHICIRSRFKVVVGGSEQEILDLGFMLFNICQQGIPLVFSEMMLFARIVPSTPSFIFRDVMTELFESW